MNFSGLIGASPTLVLPQGRQKAILGRGIDPDDDDYIKPIYHTTYNGLKKPLTKSALSTFCNYNHIIMWL